MPSIISKITIKVIEIVHISGLKILMFEIYFTSKLSTFVWHDSYFISRAFLPQ